MLPVAFRLIEATSNAGDGLWATTLATARVAAKAMAENFMCRKTDARWWRLGADG
jgi:hypothetical protein